MRGRGTLIWRNTCFENYLSDAGQGAIQSNLSDCLNERTMLGWVTNFENCLFRTILMRTRVEGRIKRNFLIIEMSGYCLTKGRRYAKLENADLNGGRIDGSFPDVQMSEYCKVRGCRGMKI